MSLRCNGVDESDNCPRRDACEMRLVDRNEARCREECAVGVDLSGEFVEFAVCLCAVGSHGVDKPVLRFSCHDFVLQHDVKRCEIVGSVAAFTAMQFVWRRP